jgi:hypothetical protein
MSTISTCGLAIFCNTAMAAPIVPRRVSSPSGSTSARPSRSAASVAASATKDIAAARSWRACDALDGSSARDRATWVATTSFGISCRLPRRRRWTEWRRLPMRWLLADWVSGSPKAR